MGKPITNITIVGGGTSGWITAAYLNQRLQWGPMRNRDVSITLIESPDTGIIGVGEATVPTLKHTLKHLNISEAEFMQRTDATFKLGIWFKDWNRDSGGEAIQFVHPFTGGMTVNGYNPGYSYKKHGVPGRPQATDQDFVRLIGHARDAMEGMRGPRALNGPKFGGALQYAYHIHAGKLADFLSEVCTARGVKHLRDNVVDVKRDERGFISALQLKQNGEWPVELVVDCTGFKGLLINETMGEPFESYADYLFNDRAIPIQIKHPDPDKLEPMTTSTALSAGWSWHIPLQSRIGTGYVFSSRFKSEDEAIDEFRAYLGPAADGANPRVIKMRVGRNRRSWVKNCVAIGLSSGFVEPLESTAIMSVELQARWLLLHMPTADFEQPLIDQFNNVTARLYDEVRDFLGIHFTQTNREDTPYWRAVRHEAKKSDSLAEHLALWKYALPGPLDPRVKTVFNQWSLLCILMGKNFYKDASPVGEEVVPMNTWKEYLGEIRKRKAAVMNRLASHKQLVTATVAEAIAGESVKRAKSVSRAVVDDSGSLAAAIPPIMAPHG